MTLETNEQDQKKEIFDIKRQSIEKLNGKDFEKIQEKFLVSFNWTSWDDIPRIMEHNWIHPYRQNPWWFLTIQDTAIQSFPYFLKNIERTNGYWNIEFETRKSEITAKWVVLFKLEQVFIKDWLYFFYTSDWQILTADKRDFDYNWLHANSLAFFWTNSSSYLWKMSWPITIWELTAESNWDWFINFKKNLTQKSTIPWDSVFKIKETSIIISDKWWNLQEYVVYADWTYKLIQSFSVPYKEISQIAVDHNNNFLFIVEETEEWPILHILIYNSFVNKHEIEEVYSIKNVKRVCGLWKDNWMICKMADDSLQYYRNTFSKFSWNFFKDSKENWIPWWKLIYPKDKEVTTIVDSGKSDLLKSLENWGISIEIVDDEMVDEDYKMDKNISDKIWNLPVKIGEDQYSLKQLFEDADDEKAITKVYEIFWKIKRNPEISKASSIIRNIEKVILDKKNKIILSSIFSELWKIWENLNNASNLATLITIKDKLKEIQRKRKNIQAWIVAEDRELKELLEIVNQKISEFKESHKEELELEIQNNFEKIKDILEDIENAIDISSIYATPLYKATEDLIACLDTNWQIKYRKLLRDLVQDRWKAIKEKSNKVKKEEQEIIEAKKKEIEDNIEQIKEILEEIEDIETIQQYRENDALVQMTKDLLSDLPSSDAQILDLKLDKVFWERIFSLRVRWEESKWVVQNLDAYWVDTILYYDESWSEQVDWKIEWKEKPDGKISLIVKLMNWETHEYDKSLYLKDFEKYWDVTIKDWDIKFDFSEEEFSKFSRKLSKWKNSWKQELQKILKDFSKEQDLNKKEVLRKKVKELKEYYKDARYTELLVKRLIKQQKLNPRSKVPSFDPDYIVLDEEKQILKELSTRLVDQKHNSWVEILEWWPWLWKTVMCEFLANVTNREIIRVQCSKMDPSDMFFSPTLKKWETSREPADWIKLMQKPWTIILFDEIDKLNDQCFERLHSLFDRSRSVYDPQLWKIKANPDCLFLWTRNSYDRLSNPIISRWRILQINYPWELNESYKISKYTDSAVLKKLSFEEFQVLYNKYITRAEGAPNNVHERKIYDLIINIKHLLNVFTELRKQYDSDEPFMFELSYRDARQIFVDYNSSWDFKKAMEEVLIPKARAAVRDSDEKKVQEDMVRDAINSEM